MDDVSALIKETKLFTEETIAKEVDWFYGPLGLHDFYFSGQSPQVIAAHIQRYVYCPFLILIICLTMF